MIRVYDLDCLEPGDRERTRRLLRANKAALVALLASGSPRALAVRQEARYGSNRRSWEEAA